MIRSLICLVMGHRINRQKVWHQGHHFRTKCRRCERPLIREQGGWVPFDPAIHGRDNHTPGNDGPVHSACTAHAPG